MGDADYRHILSKISSQLEAIDEKLAFLAKDAAMQHGMLEEWRQKEREAEAEANKGDIERMVERQMAPQPHTLDHIGKDPFGTYG